MKIKYLKLSQLSPYISTIFIRTLAKPFSICPLIIQNVHITNHPHIRLFFNFKNSDHFKPIFRPRTALIKEIDIISVYFVNSDYVKGFLTIYHDILMSFVII